jgi:hypothetical protein
VGSTTATRTTDYSVSRGNNNPAKNMTITAGTPKK